MNKRCDNLNYLVALRAGRQLLLQRANGKPGGVRPAGKMAGDKDNSCVCVFFFLNATRARRSSAQKTNCRSNFLWRGRFVSIEARSSAEGGPGPENKAGRRQRNAA